MLYHFSEEPGIKRFAPRENQNREGFPPVVWAIDEEHQFTYFFPRNCPRIVIRAAPDMSKEDREQFFGHSLANTIITIESRWYARVADCTIYRYAFEEDLFELYDKTAGYYISPHTIIPEGCTPVNRLVDRLLELGVELHVTPNLYPLRDAILRSSFQSFGIHRFNQAAKP
ncbi:hypothetical protein NDS46_15350 [Paenibacillus thiaminolyticus]|uniref:DUF6886 family protein n=1 Tax=Paenibacillus thiaminolyticus TaxID=49283 RepID=UPI00232BD043|nr:DUF6886 family protein [Paenibacillus thiaminolyticus]WCF05771.1 hypothetical protein NDS46_15350 [Paenibacillus thiaminolyticus]